MLSQYIIPISRCAINLKRYLSFGIPSRLLETGNRDDIMAIFNRLPKGGVGDQRLQVMTRV